MTLLLCHLLLSYSLLFAHGVYGLKNLIVRDGEPDDTLLPKRRLTAAIRSHELGARDVQGCLKYDHNLHYLDGKHEPSDRLFWLTSIITADTRGSNSQFAAKLGMQFKIPTLMLEDVEHHIESIGCYSSEIHLRFTSAELLERVHNEISRVDSFLLITSHQGCNDDGERNPHV